MSKSNGPKSNTKVISNPYAQLAVQNHKYVKNCTELYLANQGIDELGNFDEFVNLAVLWINGNRIEKVDHLDKCFRIKQLFVQDNRLRTLEGSLSHMTFLRELRLANNRLHDLHGNLQVLSKFLHLEILDLFGNPLAQEQNYRLFVIDAIPSLQVFDLHVVTQQEKQEAAKLRVKTPKQQQHHQPAIKLPKVTKGHTSSALTGTKTAPPMSGTVALLFQQVEHVKRQHQRQEEETKRKELLSLSEDSLGNNNSDPTQSPMRRTQFSEETLSTLRFLAHNQWELAALKKRFQSLETKPKSGIEAHQMAVLFEYLRDRGFSCRKTNHQCGQLPPASAKTCIGSSTSTVAAPNGLISWPQFHQMIGLQNKSASAPRAGGNAALTSTPSFPILTLNEDSSCCSWSLMDPDELAKRANEYFQQATALQKKSGCFSDQDDRKQKTLVEAQHIIEKAYHLDAMASNLLQYQVGAKLPNEPGGQRQEAREEHGGSMEEVTAAMAVPPVRTRFFVTSFTRNDTFSAEFHQLSQEIAQIDATPSTKSYSFHKNKEFAKYLAKKHPPESSKLSKQRFCL